jgi:hypothetical protein
MRPIPTSNADYRRFRSTAREKREELNHEIHEKHEKGRKEDRMLREQDERLVSNSLIILRLFRVVRVFRG